MIKSLSKSFGDGHSTIHAKEKSLIEVDDKVWEQKKIVAECRRYSIMFTTENAEKTTLSVIQIDIDAHNYAFHLTEFVKTWFPNERILIWRPNNTTLQTKIKPSLMDSFRTEFFIRLWIHLCRRYILTEILSALFEHSTIFLIQCKRVTYFPSMVRIFPAFFAIRFLHISSWNCSSIIIHIRHELKYDKW